MKKRRTVPPEIRFWKHVEKGDGCWRWTGTRLPAGYGDFFISGAHSSDRKRARSHRFSWELSYGPIPEGMDVLHRCDNPSCVRPDHLFLGTAHDNVQDMMEKGRCHNASKTHCTNGHEFTAENTQWSRKNGVPFRVCRECRRAIDRVRDRHRPRRGGRRQISAAH